MRSMKENRETISSEENGENTAVESESTSTGKTEEKVLIVGIHYKEAGKIYYFDPDGMELKQGDAVIVDTARGIEFGHVVRGNSYVSSAEITPPLRKVLRRATEEDLQHRAEIQEKEKAAYAICLEKIHAHNLDMKLIDVEYTFDNSKLLFYFTADGRIDFRELVKDLASVFRIRIELRQIGVRDEAKVLGGLGVCGRPFCCSTFLFDVGQVSIRMAKEQNLSLNSAKISGTCGRLMCCLRYEYSTYEEEIRRTPPVDSKVKTPDGVGVVVEANPLTGFLKVQYAEKNGTSTNTIHRDKVKVISTPEKTE